MTIQEAWKKILDIRGNRTTCVTIALWNYSDGLAPECSLTLWDGKQHHNAINLESLVEIARAITETPEKVPGVIDGELPEMEKSNG